jgi:hypothetical protein
LITSNSLCTISLLLAALPLVGQPCLPAPRGLTAQFTFDGPRPPASLLTPSKVGQALRLNGTDQFWEIPLSTRGLDFGAEDFTIEGWLRTKETRSARNIIDKRDTAPVGYLVFVQNGQLGFQLTNGADRSDTIARGKPINDGNWHHFAVVAQRLPPQPAHIYVDGVEVPSRGRALPTEAIDTPQIPLWFGRHHRNVIVDRENMFFAGDIDEVAFYRRPLTVAEVRALFRAGSAGKCPSR